MIFLHGFTNNQRCSSHNYRDFSLTGLFWACWLGLFVFGFRGHTNIVTDACFTPDERMFATVAWDKCINFYDVSTGTYRCVQTKNVHCIIYTYSSLFWALSPSVAMFLLIILPCLILSFCLCDLFLSLSSVFDALFHCPDHKVPTQSRKRTRVVSAPWITQQMVYYYALEVMIVPCQCGTQKTVYRNSNYW